MSAGIATGLVVLTIAALFLAGLPISFALMSASIIWVVILRGFVGLTNIPLIMYDVASKDIYLAIPLFILMGMILERSGFGSNLYDAIHKWLGRLHGGLAITSIIACTMIAAMTGLGGTGVLVVGTIALPEMLRRGYEKRFALGFLAPGGALGPLIPPSIYMIMLGGLASISVGSLFLAGLTPGLMSSFIYIVYIWIRAWRNPTLAPRIPAYEAVSWSSKFAALKQVAIPAMVIVGVLGSIYTGIATPTECGAVGTGIIIACSIALRRLSWRSFKDALYRSLIMTVMVMWLLMTGVMFGHVLVLSHGTSLVENWFMSVQGGTTLIVFIMILVTYVAGMFLEGPIKLIILTPLFYPIIFKLGVDPLWFSIIYAMAGITGYYSPPVGNNLFYLQGLIKQLERLHPHVKKSKCTLNDIYVGVIPYCFLQIIVIALVWFFPWLALWPVR